MAEPDEQELVITENIKAEQPDIVSLASELTLGNFKSNTNHDKLKLKSSIGPSHPWVLIKKSLKH